MAFITKTVSVYNGGAELKWFTKDKRQWAIAMSQAKAMGGRWNPERKAWTITEDRIGDAIAAGFKAKECKNLPPNKFSIVPKEYREYATAPEVILPYDIDEAQKNFIANYKLDPDKELIPGLRDYQIDFLKFADYRKGKVMLLDDMGTGKTLQSLAWLAYNRSFPALIVVNSPTKLQWKHEFRRWLSLLPGCPTRCQVLNGQKPRKLESGISAVINWDILQYWADTLVKMGFRCLIGDEAQAIGNPDSKRAKAFVKLAKAIPECIVMSGTPARSRPEQMYTMISCVEPTAFPSFEAYRWRFCGPKVTNFGLDFGGASKTKELHSWVVQCGLRRTKDQVMKFLPPKTIQVVPVDTDEGKMKEYQSEQMSLEGLNKSELEEAIRNMSNTAFLAKQQGIYDWIDDFIETSGEKLLIFAYHRNVVDLVCESLAKYKPAKIYGGISGEDRLAQIKRFQEDPECKVLVGNIQAAGTGIDGLQKVCCNVGFVEFSFTPTDMSQAEDRLHRGGQERPVNVYYFIAPDTVDEDVIAALDQKRKMLDSVVDGKETEDFDLIGEIAKKYL